MSVSRPNHGIDAVVDKGVVKILRSSKSENRLKHVYLHIPEGIAQKLARRAASPEISWKSHKVIKVGIQALKVEARYDQGECHKIQKI